MIIVCALASYSNGNRRYVEGDPRCGHSRKTVLCSKSSLGPATSKPHADKRPAKHENEKQRANDPTIGGMLDDPAHRRLTGYQAANGIKVPSLKIGKNREIEVSKEGATKTIEDSTAWTRARVTANCVIG